VTTATCTPACHLGHTAQPGCTRADFFQPGVTYRNHGVFAGRQQVHRFRCVGVEPHPGNGEITALGWIEMLPGVWTVGGIPANDYVHNLWSEI
jgi:hypothetical protein